MHTYELKLKVVSPIEISSQLDNLRAAFYIKAIEQILLQEDVDVKITAELSHWSKKEDRNGAPF